jgi:hypothetical protein
MAEANLDSVINDLLDQEDDPITVACAKALELAIAQVLKGLGVSPDLSKDETLMKMLEKEITIQEVQEELNLGISGIYILQGHKHIKCVASITYPFVNSQGQVVTRIERYDKNLEEVPAGVIVNFKRKEG